jgi:hypothetical protein
MPILNFSIPLDLKEAFNETFRGRNKSAIIADLMRDAIERENDRNRAAISLDELLMRRATSPSLDEKDDVDPLEFRRRR